MRDNYTVARPYAQAVFELGRDRGELGAWSDMLNLISMVVSDPQMHLVLENPKLDSAFQAEFILDVCAERLSDAGRNFVRVLADARRLSQAPAIRRLFEQLRLEHEKLMDIEVISAYPLEENEKERIARAMEKRFGRKVNISSRVDNSLIGGSIIRAGDSVIDASVKGGLRHLGTRLAE